MDEELAIAFQKELEEQAEFLIPATIIPFTEEELLARIEDDKLQESKIAEQTKVLDSATKKLTKLGLTIQEAKAVIGID